MAKTENEKPAIKTPTLTKLNTTQRFELMKMASEMCTCPHTKMVNPKDVIKTYRELVQAISD